MNKIYTYILALALVGMIYGCEEANVENTPVSQGKDKIQLSSVPESAISRTRAATNFPNNGSIALVAATKLDNVPTQTNWSLYADINNDEATAVSVTNGVYSFEWKTQKYWPFDGSDLYFMAYSPITVPGNNNYILSADNSSLYIKLYPNMPDILYASENAFIPYNKTSGTVNLGMFKHVMSQLTVDVIGNATLPANIKLQSLTVSTTANVGSFFLAQGDNGLVVADTEAYYATLVNDVTDIQNTTISRSLLLFPGTEDVTEVAITLVDQNNGHVFTGEYMVSFFQGDSLDPITLQRAKNTVLRLEVNITDVDNPNETIELTGRITDWTYGGQFGIGIN